MADVQLTINIPDAYVTRAVEAFNGLSGKRININVNGEDFRGDWRFTIDPKDEAESLKEFGTRFIRELALATVRLWDYAEDQDRYSAEISGLTLPSQNIPDGAIESV